MISLWGEREREREIERERERGERERTRENERERGRRERECERLGDFIVISESDRKHYSEFLLKKWREGNMA